MQKKYRIGLAINIAIIVIGFIATVVNLVSALSGRPTVEGQMPPLAPQEGEIANGEAHTKIRQFANIVIDLILYVHIAYYALKGYKKAHGNLLRNLMLIFSLAIAVSVSDSVILTDLATMLYSIAIGAICFMAGRLHKYNQARVISIIVLAILIYCSYVQVCSMLATDTNLSIFSRFMTYNKVVFWLAITSSYFTRYLEHKEAGLEVDN